VLVLGNMRRCEISVKQHQDLLVQIIVLLSIIIIYAAIRLPNVSNNLESYTIILGNETNYRS
jgi:hypothetical protein